MIATMTAAIGDDDGGNCDFHCVLSAGNFAKDRGICGLVHDSVRAKAASLRWLNGARVAVLV